MKKSKTLAFFRDAIFILLLVYYLQGTLYEQGSIISQGTLGLMMGISGVFFLKTVFQIRNKNKFYTIWTILFLLNTTGYLFFTPEFGGRYFTFFKTTLFNLVLFYPFYYFAQKELLQAKDLIRFFIFYLPVAILQYFFNMMTIMEKYDRSEDLIVNNMAYLFVNLMPYVFLFKKKKLLSLLSMLLLMYFIIQGSKRGAIIVGGLGLVFFMYYQLKTLEGRNKIIGFFVSLISLISMGYYGFTTLMQNEYLLERLGQVSEGGFSGRDTIFSNIWNGWLNSGDYFHYLFGYGFAASLRLSGVGNYAHSDWLEMLSNFGLFGIGIYLMFYWTGFKMVFLNNWKSDKKILVAVVLCMWFLISLGSMTIYSVNTLPLIIFLGYLFGNKSLALE